jgi:hypothetical protein
MNVGIRAAAGRIIVIAGAHAMYPADFVENSVVWLSKTGADVVGGPVKTEAASNHFGAKLASLILSSPFGVGNSRFRTSSREGFVDTVPFGAYRRGVFERVGLFNETLVRNQDNDLSERIRRTGGKIYLTPALTVTNKPIRGFVDLLGQAFRKNQWHLPTIRENRRALSFRHLCPAAFVMAGVGLLLFSAWSSIARIALGILLLLYLSAGLWIAFRRESSSPLSLRMTFPFACFLFHFAYGLGTLAGSRYLFKASPRSSAPIGGTHSDADTVPIQSKYGTD